MKLVPIAHPVLRQVAKPVEQFDAELRAIANEMKWFMQEKKGCGLAAPQVGLSIRMFVASPSGNASDAKVYINPTISNPRGIEWMDEGCLSIRDVTVRVRRPKMVEITAFDENGNQFTQGLKSKLARIVQHENDHLNGVLITDYERRPVEVML